MTDALRVQHEQCQSCIYRPQNADMLPRLEAQIADPRMAGFFTGYRICHHSKNAVCAGFWAHHKDAFALGQIAQRLNLVEFVHDDSRTPKRRIRQKS